MKLFTTSAFGCLYLMFCAQVLIAQNNPITFDPQGGAGGDLFGIKTTETGNNTTKFHIYRNFTYDTSDIDWMVIDAGGKVGIGTSQPGYKLDVSGDINATGKMYVGLDLSIARSGSTLKKIEFGAFSYLESRNRFANNVSAAYYGTAILRNAYISDHATNTYKNPNSYLKSQRIEMLAGKWTFDFRQPNGPNTWNESEWINIMKIDGISGNIGIGTTTPSEKLEVNGTIRTKEVKVESTPWPDYVFSDTYQLNPLSEVSSYIRENHHLPGIPTAEEVAENGIKLGEMNAKLLEKIEELTLYLIEKDRVEKELIKRIENLESKLK